MSQTLRFTISAGVSALVAIVLFVPAHAQTQASCQLRLLTGVFTIPGGTRFLVPRGVND